MLGVILPAQIIRHLVYIKKISLLNSIQSILATEMSGSRIVQFIEHEISKIDSSSLKKIFAKKTLRISSIVVY